MPEFRVLQGKPAPAPGLVLRVGEPGYRFLRLTHVFKGRVYAMWVGEPDGARYARRPTALSMTELEALSGSPGAVWGQLMLPPALTNEPPVDSPRSSQLQAAWSLIEPLIEAFKREANLSRHFFTALIRQRAQDTETSQSTVLRTVLRYYYFGHTRFGLLPLPPGVKPGNAVYSTEPSADQKSPKRRGRQSALAAELGRNDFIVGPEDIEDMMACFRRLLKQGPTFKTSAHESYLATEFRNRHPALYKQYVTGDGPEPVTGRQFRYYVDERLRLSDELARNVRTHQRNPGYLGSVRAAGPGEIYEIDATGGRLQLVSNDRPPVLVGKPTIYLLVDRWSRFVVSAYLSLRAPSYEEVRQALLIAFTSREARFSRLGINVTDERWPVGRMPAAICPDRGSDFMSEAMEQSVVNDLRIDLTPLPPLCPDGKAIVERLIREIKRRMHGSGIAGAYADRPMDPITKRAARKAQAAAVHTLTEAYRLLVDIIEDHNNRPHRTLRRRRALTQAGVAPTPRAAYVWGLENITGLRSAPLSEDDYYRMLLSSDKASIANGVLSYKSRPYLADNEQGVELLRRSTKRPTAVDIRLDKTFPTTLFVPTRQGLWAQFRMAPGAANEIAGISLEEEEALAAHTALLWARSDHEGRVARVAAKGAKPSTPRKGNPGAAKLPKAEQTAARNQETARMKEKLHGKPQGDTQELSQDGNSGAVPTDWLALEEEERLRSLELIRKHRNKR